MRVSRITLNSFLVSLLGILTVEVGFSNSRQRGSYEYCYRGGEICYVFVSSEEQNWNTAHFKCQNKNSSLPIIQNREEQKEFEVYLSQLNSNGLRINAVWTSGKRKTYNNWTWINGQTLSNAFTIRNGYSDWETHMVINWPITGTKFILKSEHPLDHSWYLCQYKNSQCNGQQHEVNATNGCLIPSEYANASWYGARDECLSKGGDLAILTDQDLQILKNHRFPNHQYQYWIGLRRINWVWITSAISKATSSEEVKYTNWAIQTMRIDGGELCISIEVNDGQWRALICNHSMFSTVCEKRASVTTGISAGNTTVRMAACINSHNDVSSSTVGLVLGIGVIVPLLVIIIILIIIILHLKKKVRKMSVSRGDNTVEIQQYQELQRPESYVNASDNYAELRLSPE